jgi:hypothetical protein
MTYSPVAGKSLFRMASGPRIWRSPGAIACEEVKRLVLASLHVADVPKDCALRKAAVLGPEVEAADAPKDAAYALRRRRGQKTRSRMYPNAAATSPAATTRTNPQDLIHSEIRSAGVQQYTSARPPCMGSRMGRKKRKT